MRDNFLTKFFHSLRNYFWRGERDGKNHFHFFIFQFLTDKKTSLPSWTKVLLQRKMMKVLSLFFCSFFSAGQEKMLLSFLRFYFGWTKEISRTKILNISRFTVWEKGRFLTCRRRTNLEMPITSALANSWAWRAFHRLFVRCRAVVPAENTLMSNRIKISTFCSFTGQTFR